jgi:hypothetical protein
MAAALSPSIPFDLFDDLDDETALLGILNEPSTSAALSADVEAAMKVAAAAADPQFDLVAIAKAAAEQAVLLQAQLQAAPQSGAGASASARPAASPSTEPAPQPSTSQPSNAYSSSLSSIISSLEGAQGELKVLYGLLVDWNEGKLSQKNKSFATPFEIVDWVCSHPSLAPPDLYWHINQIHYDNGKSDDKHFYMASTLKKMLNMVSLEYGIPLDDMYKKFGGKSFYVCAGETSGVLGKRKCTKKANGGFFCGNHACQRCDPVSDYKRWKGEAAAESE